MSDKGDQLSGSQYRTHSVKRQCVRCRNDAGQSRHTTGVRPLKRRPVSLGARCPNKTFFSDIFSRSTAASHNFHLSVLSRPPASILAVELLHSPGIISSVASMTIDRIDSPFLLSFQSSGSNLILVTNEYQFRTERNATLISS